MRFIYHLMLALLLIIIVGTSVLYFGLHEMCGQLDETVLECLQDTP